MDLSGLGVSAYEETVYRFFLRRPRTDAASACEALGAGGHRADREAVDDAIARLEKHRLIHRGPDAAITAVDPAIGIERMIEEQVNSLNDSLRRTLATRNAIAALTEDYNRGGTQAMPLEIERIEGLPQIRARMDDLAFFARDEIMALQPGGAYLPDTIEAARPVDVRLLRRGLTMRTIVEAAAVEDPLTAAYLNELTRIGARVRVAAAPMERLLIFDRSIAVVPIDPVTSARGALVVRQAGLVTNMIGLFESTWANARDLADVVSSETAEAPLTSTERQVLAILTRVDKDEIGAREMGVSLRTFRGHVAGVMVRLEASNRFQAALLAKERGWL
ncbi:DNA-binding CsgD family transcriptional regulator/sugar-specific transcriptional regulator TrmB [Kitasatospora sp. MAA4]|uniref:LuxR C-terminal-related transcriptional regulator n=1 Tax=Kitasatospora sp. MAA4 TaxID=3035093 RepID=UPI002474E694|nr:LuxR C-terminal-related transcriptional regulator [Kitasatospora sp. MAA4]MDH6137905.1 DNA-binding CsgD family transcriptional regulator/sugar-specific transcriptional regulator TrmB [Kitasatospora sp. MAA4]